MKGGEIGVLLSHKAIYQKMIDEGLKALVFEDDAILEPNFAIVAQALVNTQSNYDLVRFLGSEKVSKLEQKIVQPLWGVYTMNKLRTAPGGAFAYSVTLQGARKMLNVLDKVYLPIDTLMGHGWLNNMQNYIVQPGLANQIYRRNSLLVMHALISRLHWKAGCALSFLSPVLGSSCMRLL